MMEDELFDVFDDTTTQQTKAKSKRKSTASESKESAERDNQSKKQKKSAVDNASSSSSSGAATAAAAASSSAASTSSSSAAAVASSSSAPTTLEVGGEVLTEEDASFYSYTEQHVSVKTTTTREDARSCTSEICYPPNWDLSQDINAGWKQPAKPAKEYPFVLDPFQRYAVDCLEKNQSVLVSAHTSAGKTVVAEYAIAMALRDGQRVIYTSPIKALSNQKYRELYEEFNDVGLMTGDVTINPSASCLVMTTEILRNMLYRGSEVMRECAFVIFDEVHYMRNKERGVVWEETIIMLPDKVRYVFLSATIPNGTEFALWIAKLHKQPCNVVYTDFRPTPLQHYLFPAGGEGLYLIVDEKGNFREENFQKALAILKADNGGAASASGVEDKEGGGGAKGSKKKKGGAGGKPTGPSDIYKIVRMIMERHYEPVIIFSFSKRECEQHALHMSKLDFCSEDEKKLTQQIFDNAMEALSDDDRSLPQVSNILPLLKRGIGIHHGGLLPILKEVIEILFQEGLIKALFSTETFSMGLNMPVKCAVFTSVKKWDGETFRIVSGGEYIQMSGRAGRRGLDDRGIVICMLDEDLEPNQAREMMKGRSDALDSSFHLGYNMLLNLLRVEDQNPVKMMARSFLQFQNTRKAPAIQEQINTVEKERAEIHVEDLKGVQEFVNVQNQVKETKQKMVELIHNPQYIVPFLNPGRLLFLKNQRVGDAEWGWGVLLGHQKKSIAKESKLKHAALKEGNSTYTVDVLYLCAQGSGQSTAAALKGGNKKNAPKLPQNQKPAFLPAPSQFAPGVEYLVVPLPLELVQDISSVRLNLSSVDVKTKEGREKLGKTLEEVKRRFSAPAPGSVAASAVDEKKSNDAGNNSKKNKDKKKQDAATSSPSTEAPAPTPAPVLNIPLLDPVEDMKISDESFLKLRTKYLQFQQRMESHKYFAQTASPAIQAQLALYGKRAACDVQLLTLKENLRNATADVMMHTQLKRMQVVLRRLEHTTSTNVIDLKGRVACEISTCDELLATELMFMGVFNDLSPEVCVALCSCLVFNEKNDDVERVREELAAPLRLLQEAAKRVATVMNDAQLTVDVEEYVARFQPQLMEVVYAWCKGAKFSEVCKLTDVFEGTIIRCLRRLEELLRQFATAAKSVGNELLESKFNAGIAMLKRDIVFAASLYL